MRPAPDVWGKVEGRLNRRRRQGFITSAFFLVTASLFGYLIIDHSKMIADPFAGIHPIQKYSGSKETAVKSQNSEPQLTWSASPRQYALAPKPGALTGSVMRQAASPVTRQTIALLPTPAANAFAPPQTFAATPVDEYQPFLNPHTFSAAQPAARPAADLLTIESVINSFKGSQRLKKSVEFYFTPTISYRRLTENKSYLRAVPQNMASFNLVALYDVNSIVTHKPGLGLEFGAAAKFPLTRRISLRGGLQFNITRYDIKAFTYVPERTVITLNSRSRGVDYVNAMSSYRNFGGTTQDWLQNLYFQVSAPVGVDVVLSNAAQKTRIGVAATIQPTFVVSDRAYLLSNDYKNYSQVPWLIRRGNVNTAIESYVMYNTGKVKWQVGPQMRYQLLSSFVQKYPVKENLFDFGLKVGITLDKK